MVQLASSMHRVSIRGVPSRGSCPRDRNTRRVLSSKEAHLLLPFVCMSASYSHSHSHSRVLLHHGGRCGRQRCRCHCEKGVDTGHHHPSLLVREASQSASQTRMLCRPRCAESFFPSTPATHVGLRPPFFVWKPTTMRRTTMNSWTRLRRHLALSAWKFAGP